ncbi:hypothetical protein BDF20DRAFT_807306, partial [Mycotypha africana]|uniref:uncharacterized protein n=1 Tax=Mycotypha africana TaxID=64632 RepID=UPI002300F93F
KCISCKGDGHTISRSPDCSNHTQSKQEFISAVLGSDSTMFTRKLPVSRAALPEYREKFMEKVISCCKDLRAIMFRCQLFVNAYLVHNKKNDFPSGVFTQQFWYSIGQLVTGKKVAHKTAKLPRGQVFAYTNSIVKLFEKRMLKYLIYKLESLFV